MNLQEALDQLRKEKKKFVQSVDLIINLKGIDVKRDNISTIITIPHKVADKKVCAFLNVKSSVVDSITPVEFQKYKDKKELKNIVKKYDFFIAEAKLMPQIATVFGKSLGPVGKMPSPQLGVLMQTNDENITSLLKKIDNSVKIRVKEASVKISVGKENMDDKKIIENITAVYNGVINVLPTKKDNLKNVLVKLTMSKPISVEVK